MKVSGQASRCARREDSDCTSVIPGPQRYMARRSSYNYRWRGAITGGGVSEGGGKRPQVEGSNHWHRCHRWRGVSRGGGVRAKVEGSDHRRRGASQGGGERSQVAPEHLDHKSLQRLPGLLLPGL